MKNQIIQYRRERATETLDDARILYDAGKLLSAANRVYYALFYEVIALLLLFDLSSPKHSGVRALLNQKFVKTGKISVSNSRFYSEMFEFRHKADYADIPVISPEMFEGVFESAERFIANCEQVISENTVN
ncbi:MAG: HEPN domain-containing protein [Bacillota bacterium]